MRTVQLRIGADSRGSIVVDGNDLSKAVNGVEVWSRVGHTTTLTLHMVAPVVEIDGQCAIEIVDKTRDALIALGWTPPIEG